VADVSTSHCVYSPWRIRQVGIKQRQISREKDVTPTKALIRNKVGVIHLHALTPVAPRAHGVLVLTSHAENILLGSDTDLVLGVIRGAVLLERRCNVLTADWELNCR